MGEQLSDRLTALERVGSGAMADVYRGVLKSERGVKKPVAIKRLRAELQRHPEAVDLFVNEASICVRLSHPHVVQGIELSRGERGYYLVSEWLDGVTAGELTRRLGALPAPWVVQVGLALCDALDYLHNLVDDQGAPLGLLHRDITPENVFVSESGQIKLTDFGVATCASAPCTVSLEQVGTPGFAAPEQAQGRASPRSDIYGLGATLLALADGPPPPSLGDILAKATAPDEAERFSSAQALRDALAEVARTLGPLPQPTLRERVAACRDALAQAPRLDGHVSAILGDGWQQLPAPPLPAPSPSPRVRWRWSAALAIIALGILSWLALPPQRASQGELERSIPGDLPAAPSEAEPPAAGPPFETRATALEPPAALEPPKPAPSQPRPTPLAQTETATETTAENAPAAKPVEQPAAEGTVSINTLPWSEVHIDGEPLGTTPLGNIRLKEGAHRLLARHPPDGSMREFIIEVRAHHHQALVLDLRQGSMTSRIITP